MGRNRVTNACERCRLLKTRCTEIKPCSRCKRHNLNCIYPKTKSLQPIESHRDVKETSEIQLNDFDQPKASISSKINMSSSLELKNHYKLELGNYCPDPGYFDRLYPRIQNLLLVNICQNNANSTGGIQNEEYKIPRIQHYGWNMSGAHYYHRSSLPSRPDIDMHPYHSELLRIYENEINPLFSILNEEFIVNLKYEPYERNNFESELSETITKEALFIAILYLVYSLSIRFREFNKYDTVDENMLQKETECFQYGFEVISLLSFDYSSIDILRGWLLISLYLRISHRQKTFLSSLYQANLLAKCMYLHRKIDNTFSKGTDVFWSLFIFDQISSIQLGLSSFWKLDDISHKLPENYPNEFSNTGFSVASFAMLKISTLAHKVTELHRKGATDDEVLDIRRESSDVHNWLETEGFKCMRKDNLVMGKYKLSTIIKSQIMLHFYDVTYSLNGPILFNHVGQRYKGVELNLDELIFSMKESLAVLMSLKKLKILQSPWYLTLIHIFSIGTFSLSMINGGINCTLAQELFSSILNLAIYLSEFDSKVYELNVPRVNMVKEVIWALSQGMKSIISRHHYQEKQFSCIKLSQESKKSVNSRRFGDLQLENRGNFKKRTNISSDDRDLSGLSSTDPSTLYNNFDWMSSLFDDIYMNP